MNWFKTQKENLFEKYPDVEMRIDGFEPFYRLKYTECTKDDRGVIRFERKEKTIPKDKVISILSQLING
jgi:hypothetical protein